MKVRLMQTDNYPPTASIPLCDLARLRSCTSSSTPKSLALSFIGVKTGPGATDPNLHPSGIGTPAARWISIYAGAAAISPVTPNFDAA